MAKGVRGMVALVGINLCVPGRTNLAMGEEQLMGEF